MTSDDDLQATIARVRADVTQALSMYDAGYNLSQIKIREILHPMPLVLDAAERAQDARNALSESQIVAIIEGIEDDIIDRRGFRHVWDNLDQDIVADIKSCWREAINRAL